MASYNFKSVGKTIEKKIVETIESTKTPIGIKTPLQINTSGKGEIFVTYDSLGQSVKDNFRNLLLTNWGERVALHNFGANLRPLMAELVSDDDFDSKAIQNITNAVNRWMPFIVLENYVSKIEHEENYNGIAHVNLEITYSIPTLEIGSSILQVNLYAM